MFRRLGYLTAMLLLTAAYGTSVAQTPNPPNVVLILADDLGFSDIEPYGSEINTPTLTALAEQGIRFSNYHTAASCAPSRAMLLTGVDSHVNGVPNIPEAIPAEQRRHANYQGVLGRNVVTLASLLQSAGYNTYMAGKWHLGKTPELLPSQRGFGRTVAMADTGTDNWEQKPYIPIYEKANWFADGKELQLPEDYYSSEYLVDKTIEFIDGDRDDDQPFFAYLPFLAVHIPVQAPQEFTDRYIDQYDQGWHVLRQQRRDNAVALGLVPSDTKMVEMSTTQEWDSLSAEEKQYNAKRMAVYGGMVEAMDFHIGRLVEYLAATDQLDNTIFVFTSDNGAEPSGAADPQSLPYRMAMSAIDYSVDYETLGLKGSFNSIAPSHTSAAVSPLAYYKFYAGEGGMRVPLIMSGKPLQTTVAQTDAFSFVTDIAPTILELAGVSQPAEHFGGRAVEPMVGRSLMPILTGETDAVYAATDPVGYELAGNAALFLGDYKIVVNRGPVGDGDWQLFNIKVDPGETSNLAGQDPERLRRMLALYADYVEANGVLPVTAGYQQSRQIALNGLRARLAKPAVILLLTLGVLLPFYIFARSRRNRRPN